VVWRSALDEEQARWREVAREDRRSLRRCSWLDRLGEVSNVMTGLGGPPTSIGRIWVLWFLCIMSVPVLIALPIAYPDSRLPVLVAALTTLSLVALGIKGLDFRINYRDGPSSTE
jgi:hypothetical protein